MPEYLAADAPAAYYFPPAADGSRPGTYYVNTHAPEEKSRTEAESIGYHEAIPGHHLQLAIAAELTDLPDFQRFGFGNTAYVEGWALYTERLAEEMGLYGGRPRPARHAGRRRVAGRAPRRGHRPARPGLDPPARPSTSWSSTPPWTRAR